MASENVDKKRKEAEKNPKKNGWNYLKYLELNNIHRPRDVIKYGIELLNANAIPSANNKWRLLERIIISSLELNEQKIAIKYLNELIKKFGQNSKRVKLLYGMYYESLNDYEEAEKYYNHILSVDSNHMNALKRKISLLITQNKLDSAISSLVNYLELYSNDYESWKTLLSLYLKQHHYEYAKFCMEELLLFYPNNYLLYLNYAEILYNLGNNNNYMIALKYFSQSLLLSSDYNTRALWGIVMCVRALGIKESDKKDKKQMNTKEEKEEDEEEEEEDKDKYNNNWLKKLSSTDRELLIKASEKLAHVYSEKSSPLVNIIKDILIDFIHLSSTSS